ncbi:1-phosphofructokinase [Paenibacillus puerhi]|uniref:1-phosphofructokinase n=1 Tax=Paenibacillus puerhi TaxID=2692622 RepID=UPI001357974A|nr:1-phosphofructokinase [Paenibacillus puerhi]
MSKHQVVTVTLNPSMDKTVLLTELKVGGLNRALETRLDPGGKGINVARILQSFRIGVTATGFIAGSLGGQIRQELSASGIRTEFIEVPGETRTNLKLVDQAQRITTEVNESGFNVGQDALALLNDRLELLLENTEVLVLGGSLPQGADHRLYRSWIAAAKDRGVKTILDADGAALAAGVEAAPYAVKPNLYELEQLIGGRLHTEKDIMEAGRVLLSRGVRLVLISMGADGAIAMSEEQAYRVKPFPIQALSTVGAGDSMVAVMAYALLENKPLSELAKWSTAAGTITASKSGTQVCTFEEIERLASQVQVNQVLIPHN